MQLGLHPELPEPSIENEELLLLKKRALLPKSFTSESDHELPLLNGTLKTLQPIVDS
ncbi:hypothetical protein RchiOBHm_Chr6g0287761 [Rosa chinensis]|uniref:Uncharacterized protein n=1 Tax=Rosa chinensis TaxID=74649 RepID=A0A2P6PV86_ROSCH|nr:hypothetical protein RchiOBHm_Chr6g0287761 [Rosa chinensis]